MIGFVFLGFFILWATGIIVGLHLGWFADGLDITDAWLKGDRDEHGNLIRK